MERRAGDNRASRVVRIMLLAVVACVALESVASAQNVSAVVDRTEITSQESVQLRILLQGLSAIRMGQPEGSDFMVGGRRSSTAPSPSARSTVPLATAYPSTRASTWYPSGPNPRTSTAPSRPSARPSITSCSTTSPALKTPRASLSRCGFGAAWRRTSSGCTPSASRRPRPAAPPTAAPEMTRRDAIAEQHQETARA